jgi:hypothetical protein
VVGPLAVDDDPRDVLVRGLQCPRGLGHRVLQLVAKGPLDAAENLQSEMKQMNTIENRVRRRTRKKKKKKKKKRHG